MDNIISSFPKQATEKKNKSYSYEYQDPKLDDKLYIWFQLLFFLLAFSDMFTKLVNVN